MSSEGTKRLYHFLKTRDAISDLQGKWIKLSAFGRVNDDQELLACCFPGYEQNHQQLIEVLKRQFRFLCFAPNGSSPEMWKRYGDNGMGICFALDVKCAQTFRVEYVRKSEPKPICIPLDLVGQIVAARAISVEVAHELELGHAEKLQHVCKTKLDKWSDEKEERQFFNNDLWRESGGLQFARFNDEDLVLREVIFGEFCNVCEDQMSSLIKNWPFQPIRVRKHSSTSP